MNITSPITADAARAAELPGESVTALLKTAGSGTGLFDDTLDGGLGMVMSGLAGVAAALAVAILLSFYFRSGYRSPRDMIKHGLAATLVLALLAFAVYDMGHAALAYLGINPAKPAVEFEIRRPRAALMIVADAEVEMLTGQEAARHICFDGRIDLYSGGDGCHKNSRGRGFCDFAIRTSFSPAAVGRS